MTSDADEGSRDKPVYLSYLLRLWRVEGGEQPVWRASLKSARGGEQVGFASLEELFEFLQKQTSTFLNTAKSPAEV